MNKQTIFTVESLLEFIKKQKDGRFLDMQDCRGEDIGCVLIQYGRFLTHKPCRSAGFHSFHVGNRVFMVDDLDKNRLLTIINRCPREINNYGKLKEWLKQRNFLN